MPRRRYIPMPDPDRGKRRINQREMDGTFIREWASAKEAGENTTAYYKKIEDVCRGDRSQSGGFRWEYANGEEPFPTFDLHSRDILKNFRTNSRYSRKVTAVQHNRILDKFNLAFSIEVIEKSKEVAFPVKLLGRLLVIKVKLTAEDYAEKRLPVNVLASLKARKRVYYLCENRGGHIYFFRWTWKSHNNRSLRLCKNYVFRATKPGRMRLSNILNNEPEIDYFLMKPKVYPKKQSNENEK